MAFDQETSLKLCRPSQNDCENNGKCFMSNLGNKLCSCKVPYYGAKCQLIVPNSKEYENMSKVLIDRTLTITGIVITCCILVLILTISWYISWRRRKDYENWKSNRRKCYRYKTIQVDIPDPKLQRLQQELQQRKCETNPVAKKVSIGVNTPKSLETFGNNNPPETNLLSEQKTRKTSLGNSRDIEQVYRTNAQQMQLIPYPPKNSRKDPPSLYDENSDSESEFILNPISQQKSYSRFNSYPPQQSTTSCTIPTTNNSRHRTATEPITSLPAMESETTALLNSYSPRNVQKRHSGGYLSSHGLPTISNNYAINGSPYTGRSHNPGELLNHYPVSPRYHTTSLVRGEHHYSNPYVNLLNRSSNTLMDHPLYQNDFLAHNLATDNFYNSSSGCTNLNYIHQSHPAPPPPPLNHQPYSYHPQTTRLMDEMNHMSPAALRVASEHDALLHELIDRGYATYEHQHSNNFLASSRSRQIPDSLHFPGRSGVF